MRIRAFLVPSVCLLLTACGPTYQEEIGSTDPDVGFEEFADATYREPWPGGVYIVNGDTPLPDKKHLREFYDQLHGSKALIIQSSGGADIRWSSAYQRDLTYCVSDEFGSRKQQVMAAMGLATTDGWETVADIDFVHLASEDSNCHAQNPQVVFDIRPTSGAPYLARAFFPNQSRPTRNIIIDSSAFGSFGWPLANVLAHELGHALGFRHEHTRPEAASCFEDSSWRELTPYDTSSVMHYPQCGGTNQDLSLSEWDAEGAQAVYGPPGAGSGVPEPLPRGVERSGTASGQLGTGEEQAYQPLSVLPDTVVTVTMTGTGDADLYVRFDAPATRAAYDCRPYAGDSFETCSLDVPAGASEAHILVHGYSSASYQFDASWIEP